MILTEITLESIKTISGDDLQNVRKFLASIYLTNLIFTIKEKELKKPKAVSNIIELENYLSRHF